MNSIPLSIQIDLMKFQLNSLILNNSLTDEVVIYFSQKLDKLIVKYELAKNSDALRKRAV
ncbi:MAG: aspartyl-phosphate phosphatase Spo0E family protein [Solirubrobacterales bacterium]